MDDLGKGLGPALVASWVRAMGRTDAFKCLGRKRYETMPYDALRWWIHLSSWGDVLLRTRMIYELYRLLMSELLSLNLKIFEVCCCTMLNSEARNLVLVALRPLLLADDLHHSAG